MTTTAATHALHGDHKENIAVKKIGAMGKETSMKYFKFHFNKEEVTEQQIHGQKGLADSSNTVNTANNVSQGCTTKMRKDSVGGKAKRVRKVPLVKTHSRVNFKPAGSRPSTGKKKPFTVKLPQYAVPNADEICQMDVDSPTIRIRNLMTRKPHGVLDIDAVNDPMKCTVYAHDVINYLQVVEISNELHDRQAQRGYPHMRTVLVDWLIQVQVHLELSQNILHLCVALIDRYLSQQTVRLQVLQLIGITSLLISAKYHERVPPEICELCHLTDGTYTLSHVLRLERRILKKMDFDLNIPGPIVFLERFLLVHTCDKTVLVQSMSMFILDQTLTDVSFVHYYPSLLAASAIYVSRGLIGCDIVWDEALSHYTKYSENDLVECTKALRRTLSKMSKSQFTGANVKYSNHYFHNISGHKALLNPSELWPEVLHKDENARPLETVII